jgi:DNA-binding NarL/FixJ family response regulator
MARTVLVVDDSGSYRATARAVLAARGFEIAGEAADGAEALTAVERLRPDAVLLDVNLPDMLGTAVARELQAGSNGAPDVVLISTEDASTLGSEIQTCGARGFLPKDELASPRLVELLGAP